MRQNRPVNRLVELHHRSRLGRGFHCLGRVVQRSYRNCRFDRRLPKQGLTL